MTRWKAFFVAVAALAVQLASAPSAAPAETGSFSTGNGSYTARFSPAGFSLGAPADPGAGSYSIRTTHISGRPVRPSGWTSDTTTTRTLSPGVTERVTSLDGGVEWDLILSRAPRSEVTVDAAVDAGGSDPVASDGSLRWATPAGSVSMGELVVKDATGRTLHRALPATTPGGVRLSVPARAFRGARYPVTLDPLITTEFATATSVTTSAEGGQAGAGVTAIGGTFLVAWRDARTIGAGTGSIYATRVASDGTVLDPLGIAIASTRWLGNAPSVATNGSEWLVVWERSETSDQGIFGQRISASGTLVGSRQTFSSEGSQPALAFGASKYLLAYQVAVAGQYDLVGSTFDSTFSGGSGLLLSAAPYDQRSPAVAWNGSSFLVAWTDFRTPANGPDLYGLPITEDATFGTEFPIKATTAWEEDPALASSGTSFLCAWTDGVAEPHVKSRTIALPSTLGAVVPVEDFYLSNDAAIASTGSGYLVTYWENDAVDARPFNTSGTATGTPVRQSNLIGTAKAPAIAWNGTTFFIAWDDPRFDAGDIVGTRSSTSGVAGDPTGILVSKGPNSQANPAVAYGAGQYLVVWEDNRGGNSNGIDIYASRVSMTGVVLDGAGIPIATTSENERSPAVAFSGGYWMIVYESASGSSASKILGKRVDTAGVVVVGGAIEVSTVDGTTDLGPSIAYDGIYFMVAWGEGFDVSARLFDITGRAASAELTVANGSTNDGSVSVAAAPGNGNFLIAWDESSGACLPGGGCNPEVDVRARLYSYTGAPVGGILPIAVATGSDAGSPAAAFDGAQFVVAWVFEYSPTDHDIYARLVGQDASLPGPAAIAVETSVADQISVQAAGEGGDFLIGYSERGASTGWDVRGARLGHAGVVLEQNVTLTNATGDETQPMLAGGPVCRVAAVYQRLSSAGTNRAYLRYADQLPDAFPGSSVAGTSGSKECVTIQATRETGEPVHVSPSGNRSIWYTWSPPAGGTVTIDTAGSTFDTLLAVYTGSALSSLTPVAGNDDSGGTLQSRVQFLVQIGTTLRIAIDGFGGQSGLTRLNWLLDPDVTPPDTTITAGPSGTTNISQPPFEFVASEPSQFECSMDGAAYATCVSPHVPTALADGAHTFRVRAIDLVGNVDPTPAERTFTVDRTPPETTITSGPSGLVATAAATLAFISSEPGSAFECLLDGAAFAPCTSPATYTGLAEGPHTFGVRAIDGAGNQDATPAYRTWTVDTIPPDTLLTTVPPDPSAASSGTFFFTSTEPGSTFECSLDGAAFAACTPPYAYSSLLDGAHTFHVRAIDLAGNVDPTPAMHAWTIDTLPPDTSITVAPGSPVNDTTARFEFTSTEPGSAFECSLDDAAFAPCSTPHFAPALAAGGHSFRVRANDAAGNVDPTPATHSWTVVYQGLVVTKTADAPYVVAGGQDGYAITVTNANPFAASLDTITDLLPPGFAYVGGSTTGAGPPAVTSGARQALVWIGPFTIPAGGTTTIAFRVTVPAVGGEYFNDASGTSTAFQVQASGPTAPVRVTAPLTTSKTVQEAQRKVGQADAYTITISNPNPWPGSVATITDALPAGFAYMPGTTALATVAEPAVAASALTWAGPFTVPANGSITLRFCVTVATVPGEFDNNAGGAGGAGWRLNASGPTAHVSVTADPLKVSKIADAGVARVNGPGGYTIAVYNPNFVTVRLGSLYDDLPAGFAVTPETSAFDGATVANPMLSGGRWTWTGPFDVGPRNRAVLAFRVVAGPTPGTVWNVASAAAAPFTVTGSGPTAPVTVIADALRVSVTALLPRVPRRGGNEYRVSVANPNAAAAPLTQIVATLPEGFTYVSGSSSGPTTANPAVNGRTLTWNGTFGVGPAGSITLRFQANAGDAAGRHYTAATGAAGGGFAVDASGPSAPVEVYANSAMTADPALFDLVPGAGVTFPALRATLTDSTTGAPLRDRTVTFYAGGTVLCHARTNERGVATCGTLTTAPSLVVARGYIAIFNGDAQYAYANAIGSLARVAGQRVLP